MGSLQLDSVVIRGQALQRLVPVLARSLRRGAVEELAPPRHRVSASREGR